MANRGAIAVAAVAFVGYFAVARIVGNVYPFSTFPMYAEGHRTTASRIVAKDAKGVLHEVTDATAWSCDSAALDPSACTGPDVYAIHYVDREAIDCVRATQVETSNAPPVDLVRHVWAFPDDEGPPTTRDCRIAACRAVVR
jgi:hypothetical protein